jgi:hypothetical protein
MRLFGELVQYLAYGGVIWRLKVAIVREGISFVTRERRGGRKRVEGLQREKGQKNEKRRSVVEKGREKRRRYGILLIQKRIERSSHK